MWRSTGLAALWVVAALEVRIPPAVAAPLMAAATCSQIEVPQGASSPVPRPLLPEDLISLRDIGTEDRSSAEARLFALSPDRQKLAFQLSRADPKTNNYCFAMFVIAPKHGAKPLLIDQGGEPIRSTSDFRGKAGFPTGYFVTVSPRWSPDGTWVAFLKRVAGSTQIWRADADGKGSEPLTHVAFNVEDFRITDGGQTILFFGRPEMQKALAAIEREGMSGFHFDDRYAPASSNRPYPAPPVRKDAFLLTVATGDVRPATTDEARAVGAASNAPERAIATARSQAGRRVWLQSIKDNVYLPTRQLVADGDHGRQITCDATDCTGNISSPWWMDDGKRVRFFKLEGPRLGTTSIFEWTPGQAKPRRLFSTEDLLPDCEPLGEQLVCLREGSTTPRRITLLDPATGRSGLIFDPNPEFNSLLLGRVERMSWKNSFGLETIGDLVLPVSFKPGTRYPLIVVQYDTRGFLRGGTGNEFPIQAFANRGYAVLSFSRPLAIGYFTAGSGDAVAIDKANLSDFADRKSVQSSLDIAVRTLIARGLVDPKRIGITGLSDGGSTVAFALLHSDLFAAAAVSSCCWDNALLPRVGPNAARDFVAEGYPRITDDDSTFWEQISLAANARKVTAPLLLQMADSEYLSALTGFTALREVGVPIDLFVFPDEYHVKWQPAHRLAVFHRSLDWFDFWLREADSPRNSRPTEVAHWESLRGEWSEARLAKEGVKP